MMCACLVDEEEAVDTVYLDFSKAFDTTFHSILLEKLASHGLDGCIFHWEKSGWMTGPRELWSYIQFGGWSNWCSLGLSVGANPV